jgi:RNA polymerase sigma-70 factor (ECF subfamily)
VFLKVYEQLPQLRQPTKFKSWLRNITYNTCYSWLRRQKPIEQLESLTDAEHPTTALIETEVERRELRTLLRQMVDRLPEKYRTVIELCYFEGLSVVQIAEFLQLPETTIRWRIRQAREILHRKAKINGYLE